VLSVAAAGSFRQEGFNLDPGERTERISEQLLGVLVHRDNDAVFVNHHDASGMSETTALSSSLEIALSSAAEDALSVWMCGPLPLSLIALVPFNPESPQSQHGRNRESWLSVHEVVTQCVG